ncbi:hypothetical protein EAH89_26260 [Roseomonas nepalensis]|uniref:DUF6651 domain-containing protein n=1 Tax=Muricoccus nepalensis TaxID=1854500 RepID=A0A502F8N1_9PROT|nr:DUF6651 domain-containing protein [Roseomonas nepalensis]TPG45707.1 hypothetical protein EAH89_26260 [Roseomonas nepalensis]
MNVIESLFAGSSFVRDRLVVPAELLMTDFAHLFTVRDGVLLAEDRHGNAIYSPSRPGERASFEEAIEILVNASPDRDELLRQEVASGGKAITRAEFESMPAATRAEHFRSGGTVHD